MGEILYSVIFFIVAVGALITFHEYGHFWMARRAGVTVLRFSVGFGPAIFRFQRKDSPTEYVIAAIPLGGYVKMLDETVDEVSQELAPTAFNRQRLYKRSAIVAAGPLANFLLAALLYATTYVIGTDGIRPVIGQFTQDSIAEQSGLLIGDELVEVDGKSIQSWDQHHFYLLNQIVSDSTVEYKVVTDQRERVAAVDFSKLQSVDLQNQSLEQIIGMYPQLPTIAPIVGDVVSGYPAAQAGLEPNDRIIGINGKEISNWNELVETVRHSDTGELQFAVERNETILDFAITPRVVSIDGNEVKQIGISVSPQQQIEDSDYKVTVRHGPLTALAKGFETMWSTTALTVKMLIGLFSMKQSAEAIGGPIAIAEYAGKAAQAGLNNYLTFLALLSISLGILNLLPIPVLDGGHLVFHAYEAVTGSPPTEKMVGFANQIGLIMLVCLMGFAFYNDLTRVL